MEPKLSNYTDWGEYIPEPWMREEERQDRERERFEEFCKKPKSVLIWLSKAAPMPVVQKFFSELGEYELTDTLEEIYEQNRLDIEDYFWCFKESYAC